MFGTYLCFRRICRNIFKLLFVYAKFWFSKLINLDWVITKQEMRGWNLFFFHVMQWSGRVENAMIFEAPSFVTLQLFLSSKCGANENKHTFSILNKLKMSMFHMFTGKWEFSKSLHYVLLQFFFFRFCWSLFFSVTTNLEFFTIFNLKSV